MITKHERLSLFESNEIVEIPAEQWPTLWSSVDNVWRVVSRKKKEWKMVCKLRKEHVIPKRRKTVLKSHLCFASATVRFESSGKVVFQIHSQHCHSLDLADSLRRNSYILEFVKEEIKRGYNADSVMSLVKSKSTSHNYLGFKYLSQSYLRSLQNKLIKEENLEQQDSEETVDSVLLSNRFQIRKVSLQCGRSIVFINSKQLDLLKMYGNGLIVMDSTGKTNSKGYYYVTAVVRTDERRWMPIFQFWTSVEHSELYAECLK